MKSKPERIIEREILIYLNKLPNALFWKNDTVGIFDQAKGRYRKSPNPYSIRGVTDIVGIYNKSIYFIEVKSDKGILSEHQKKFIDRINRLGGKAFVARSIEDVIHHLHGSEVNKST